MKMSSIELTSVCKSYGEKEILSDISLKIEEGKIYGLLGRNGVGKTTLLHLITNRDFLSKGLILVDGEEIYENNNVLSKIYFMEEKNLLPLDMKIIDIFNWTKEFYENFNMDYAKELSKHFQLDINKKLKKLSTGYKSITKLIITLASGAQILIFDEPILGLDANHRELFYKELLKNYTENQNTIIISTHMIEEISDLLEKVIILKDKKVIANDYVENLLELAYCVGGSDIKIDEYIKDKKIIAEETLGTYKKVTILEEKTHEDYEKIDELNLDISKVELQKLFIHLTEMEGDLNEY